MEDGRLVVKFDTDKVYNASSSDDAEVTNNINRSSFLRRFE